MLKDSPHLSGSKVSAKTRTKNKQRRICLFIIVLFVFWVILIFAGTIVLFSLQHFNTQENHKYNTIESKMSEKWELIWRNAVIEVISSAEAMRGFIIGQMKSLPPYNGSIEERLAGQSFSRFENVAKRINSTMLTSPEMISAPGGVVCQTAPNVPGIMGYDLLNYDHGKNVYKWISPIETIQKGEGALIGPRISTIPQSTYPGQYVIHLRVPIYNLSTSSAVEPLKNFWGFLYFTLSVDNILTQYGFYKDMDDNDMDYITYTLLPDGLDIAPIATNLIDTHTQKEIRRMISKSVVTAILPDYLTWFLAVRYRSRIDYFNGKIIATSLCITLFSAIALLILAILIIIHCTREYSETKHAPKAAPFAILTLGFCYGDSLWNIASDEMVQITEKLTGVACKAKEQSKGCSIPQLQPYVNSYILKSADDAVRMAFAIMSELRCRPIDKSMQGLFGEEGQLLLAYAVHWCVDASVRPNPYASSGYLYDGPDVVYGGRMWMFAVPNVITLSESAKEALKETNPGLHSRVQLFNSVYIRGVRNRQNLYIIEDHNSTRMNKSLVRAVWQSRYMGRPPQYRLLSLGVEAGGNQLDMSSGLIPVFGPHEIYDNTGTDFEDPIILLGNESMRSISLSSSGNISSIGANGAVGVNDPDTNTRTPLGPPGMQCNLVTYKHGVGVSSTNTDLKAAKCSSNETQRDAANQFNIHSHSPVGAGKAIPSGSIKNATNEKIVKIDGLAGTGQQKCRLQAQLSRQLKNITPLHIVGDLSASVTKQSSGDKQKASEIFRHEVPDVKKGCSSSLQTSKIHACKDLMPCTVHSKDGDHKTSVHETELPSGTIFHPRLPASTDLPCKNPTEKNASSDALTSNYFNLSPKQLHLINVPLNPLLSSEFLSGTALEGEVKDRSLRGNSSASGNNGNSPSRTYSRFMGSNDGSRFGVNGPLGLQKNAIESSSQITSNSNTTLICSPASSSIQHPPIEDWLDAALRAAFEHQAVAIDISYESVRVLMYFFFQGLNFLFQPLMNVEKENIFERLATALEIGQESTLENISARCVIQYMQQHERELTLWWDQMLKKRERMEP